MRLHRPWKVPTHMPRTLIGSIAEMRVSISRAALLVKVTASRPFGPMLPVWISQAMRVVRTRVLPLPAPARISADWFGSVTAASCSGLRFSRSDIGLAGKPSFYFSAVSGRRKNNAGRTPRCLWDAFDPRLGTDLVVVLAKRALLEAGHHGFGVLLRRKMRHAHVVHALVTGFRRKDFSRITCVAQRLAGVERIVQRFPCGHRDLPLAAALGHALPCLRLGFRRPFLQLVGQYHRDRLRLALVAHVIGQALVQGDGVVSRRRDLDLALDEADGLAVGRGLAPQVGAADARGYRRHGDVDLAPALELGERVGREAKCTFGDFQRRLEQAVLAHAQALEHERALLAELRSEERR